MPDYVAPSATTAQKSQGGQHVRQFTNDSISSSSWVTGPAAGSTVTWVFLPISGTYSIQLLYGFGDVVGSVSNGNGNVRVQVQNVTITSLTLATVANTLQSVTMVLTALAGQSIGLNVISADANAKYVGTIIATQLG